MRNISAAMKRRFDATKRTRAQNTDNGAVLWVSRHATAMDSSTFLERELIGTFSGLSDTSIAVRRLRKGREGDRIYAAYIRNGTARVVYANTTKAMEKHAWLDSGFSAAASSVAIAFDGTMPRGRSGRAEFITEAAPWVFWVSGGLAYAEKLGSGETVTLANANATDISAVRAMHSEVGGFDFGLVAFFILNGSVYYRQLIDGVWQDAVPMNFGPSKTWVAIAASRTWDYRVALQAKASDGTLWELFTQFMGVAKQNAENIALRLSSDAELIPVRHLNTAQIERIDIAGPVVTSLYGGLYSTDVPTLLFAENRDNGSGDWGKALYMRFDVHLERASVLADSTAFTITDERGAVFTASTALVDETGYGIMLGFTDFNAARGVCVARYTPGAAVSMAETPMELTELAFTPTGLVPPEDPPPEPVALWNE